MHESNSPLCFWDYCVERRARINNLTAEMAQWILKANGRVDPRISLRPLKVDEIHSPVEIKKREVFDELIKRRWGTPMTPPNTQQPKAFEKYEDHEQQEQPTLEVEEIVDSTGKLINQQPAYDQIINAEVQLQLGEEMVNGKVIKGPLDLMGKSQEHMIIIHFLTQSSMMWLKSTYNLEKKWSMAK